MPAETTTSPAWNVVATCLSAPIGLPRFLHSLPVLLHGSSQKPVRQLGKKRAGSTSWIAAEKLPDARIFSSRRNYAFLAGGRVPARSIFAGSLRHRLQLLTPSN